VTRFSRWPGAGVKAGAGHALAQAAPLQKLLFKPPELLVQ